MRFEFNPATGYFDVALTAAGGLDSGIGNGGLLYSALMASVFTDGLAAIEDLEADPSLGTDRRGWWADYGKTIEESLGSLFWLYRRSKKNDATKLAIQRTLEDATAGFQTDGVVKSITITVAWLKAPLEGVRIRFQVVEPDGTQRDWKVDDVWAGIAS